MSDKNFTANDNGSTSVEFTLVAPVFIAIILSVFGLGFTAMQMHTVHFALVKAARAVSLNSSLTQAQVQTLVTTRMANLTGGSGVTVSVVTTGAGSTNSSKTITANYPITFTVPLVGTYTYNYSTAVTVAITAS